MNFRIHQGDALSLLRMMQADSVDCCVTSPPYFGLRDYGMAGQLGLEKNPDAYVSALAGVFDEVRRVLKPEGTLWLNLGDSYAATGKSGGGSQGKRWEVAGPDTVGPRGGKWIPAPPGLKPKDLIGIPWSVAFELRKRGWYLRSDIIWAKPNPMPESVTDRPTKAHEYLFLLSKSERYFYDREAILEPFVHGEYFHGGYDKPGILNGTATRNGRLPDSYNASSFTKGKTHDARAPLSAVGQGERKEHAGRNKRTVWTLATMATPDAHFATFPIELPETCILAGCPVDGVVLDPFAGAGTTGLAALKNGRRFVGIELNPEYIEIAHRRVQRHYPLLAHEACRA